MHDLPEHVCIIIVINLYVKLRTSFFQEKITKLFCRWSFAQTLTVGEHALPHFHRYDFLILRITFQTCRESGLQVINV